MTLNKRDTKKVIKSILELKPESENFLEIYKAVSNKYWAFPETTELRKCAIMLHRMAEVGEEKMVVMTTRIAAELAKMNVQNLGAGKLVFGFGEKEYTVDIYEDGIARDILDQSIKEAGQAIAKGKFDLKKVDEASVT